MSESYDYLAWAKDLIPSILPLIFVNLVAPLMILIYAVREEKSPESISFVILLSIALTAAAFFSVIPLVS